MPNYSCKIFVTTILGTAQEMDSVNAKIASAAVSGRLDRNPFVQGLLCQLINRIDKEDRGVCVTRGRCKSLSETEERLLTDAALSLAVAGGNKALSIQLGQKQRKATVCLEDLESLGLPNPALSLMFEDQLATNLKLIDQMYERPPSGASRRLIVAMDATYLLKTISQHRRGDEVRLCGGPWSPSNETLCWVELEKCSSKMPKAQVMMEYLAWNPYSRKKLTLSIAAMPMALAPVKVDLAETQVHAGNWET